MVAYGYYGLAKLAHIIKPTVLVAVLGKLVVIVIVILFTVFTRFKFPFYFSVVSYVFHAVMLCFYNVFMISTVK